MYPSNFYKMKNFANPKTMFKSCSNNDEFSTTPVQSCSPTKKANKPSSASGRSGSGSSSSASYKSVMNATCCSGGSSVCSPLSTPRSDLSGCTTDGGYMTPLAPGDATVSDTVTFGVAGGSETEQLPTEPHHPLNSEWTLWYLETDRSKSWEEMLHEVASFSTVENFWSLINHIKTPSEIKMGSDYCLFKKGIRPMWEDEANVKGGRWVITLNKGNKNDLDNFWLDTMLVLIGESCEYSHELCGAVVNIRGKNNKISIWTANGGNEAAALEIGGKLRDGLRMESAYVLQYQLHKDTMAKQGSLVKTIYTR
ncbi:eukaryotic translation initiation factor 4E1 [Drosophila novamexicana]|uniref:eukaryotic translation initiation factor 4E1 n=1 Tax=Drosophila novamexicana TaxID=47314 RepID=UPI0011E58DF7|nr:eukaryotic translation initiation factor 4E1 [Drosophila novamexicana]